MLSCSLKKEKKTKFKGVKFVKRIIFVSILLLMITLIFSSCTSEKLTIYEKIHSLYYDMPSYKANAEISSFTKEDKITYVCEQTYDKAKDKYTLATNDLKMEVTKDETIITKGISTLKTLSVDDDMHMFVNTFFKSYYETEDVSVTVSKQDGEKFVLLETNIINPTKTTHHMKLWVDRKTVKPYKMQIFNQDSFMHTEILFKSFDIIK